MMFGWLDRLEELSPTDAGPRLRVQPPHHAVVHQSGAPLHVRRRNRRQRRKRADVVPATEVRWPGDLPLAAEARAEPLAAASRETA